VALVAHSQIKLELSTSSKLSKEDDMSIVVAVKLVLILAALLVAVVLFFVSLGWLGFALVGISILGAVKVARRD